MSSERLLAKVGNSINRSLEILYVEALFKRPESAGTIRVADVLEDDENPGTDVVILGFEGKIFEDKSAWVRHVPAGFIKKDQIVEILVRKSKLPTDPEIWLVSIRPFNRITKGTPLNWDEMKLDDVFVYNQKDADTSPRFYKKFFENRSRVEPVIR